MNIRNMIIGALLFTTSTTLASTIHHIETRDIDQGVIHVRYREQDQNKKIKLLIQKEEQKYSYNLKGTGEYETFALQLGNGEYEIGIYENIADNKYKLIKAQQIDLAIENKEAIFLNSVQNVDWNVDSKVVSIAKEITKDSKKDIDKVRAVYQYILNEYTYDNDKLSNLPAHYLPNIEELLLKKKGICYDFASMFAAMLRSQEIPTKLAMGYHPEIDVYHSWNEVYDKEEEAWKIIDITYDLSFNDKKGSVPMIKENALYDKVREY